MSRSNGPQGQVRGATPQQWQQPAEQDPAVNQAYAAAQAAAQPNQLRFAQPTFGSVQGQPHYAPQAPADNGYYATPQYAPAQAPAQQPAYQPVFDRYAPAPDAAPRGYDPRAARPQPGPSYGAAPQPQQPSLYDTHSQPRGGAYDQWPPSAAPQQPAARGYDFSNYMPNGAHGPDYGQGHAQASQQPRQSPLQQYAEPQHEDRRWQHGGGHDRQDEFAAHSASFAQQPTAAYDQQAYAGDAGGQLQNAVDQGYDPDDVPDYEEDEPPRSRRGLVMVSALVGAIALGGGLAFAYKKFIKPPADGVQLAKVSAPKGPAKTQPADPGGKQFPNQESKLQNRLGDGSAPVATASVASQPEVDTGVRRVQLVPIGRDGSMSAPPPVPGMVVVPSQPPAVQPIATAPPPMAVAPQAAVPQASPAPARIATVTPQQPRVTAPVVNATPPEPVAAAPAVKKPTAKKAAPPRDDLAATGGAVVSAAAAPAAAKGGGSGYVAVLASRGSKAEAEKTNAEMEQRFEVLKGKPFDVQEANLTAKGKGIVYRSVVGPPGSLAFANSLCEQVKAAGHTDCWPVRY